MAIAIRLKSHGYFLIHKLRSVSNSQNISLPILRDLDGLSKYMTVAYILATVLLCGALIFSYFSLKRILVEQANLNAFGIASNELRLNIRDSSLYLSDLKSAKELPPSDSRLEVKIKARMTAALLKIEELKNETATRLLSLERYPYYKEFDELFHKPPHDIWLKLNEYTGRLKEISRDTNYGTPGMDLLWLPVEATAAKNGALGKSYETALSNLQIIISNRSLHLAQTHKNLTLISIIVVFLEILLIFIPLQRHLKKVNSKLLSATEKLYKQANYDQQTELPNASGSKKYLQLGKNEEKYSKLLIVCVENLDSISKIVGPPALHIFFHEFANQLIKIELAENHIFRAGDSEFAILLTNEVDEYNSHTVSNIQNQLKSKLSVNNAIVYPEVRLGLAQGRISASNLLAKLIDARLAAQLYNPSETVITRYDSHMRSKIEDDNLLIEQIRIGLANREFKPHYQIKMDAKSGLACGMEALCRWHLPDGTLLSPYKFIPVAEKSGLISEMTWQLLEQIGTDYKQWVMAGLNPGRIAFNAAERMLLEHDFSERIKQVVDQTGTTDCPLDLEITENVALGRESESITTAIATARDLGMRIALDDFGTGYASLSSIVKLDVDIIKVDQSFVRLMSTNASSRSIVVTIINLCQQLNKKCVVEGVETKDEMEFCKELGCDEIQGYYFHKPAPFAEAKEFLESQQLFKKAG